ncbi:hypothetical protein ACAX60_000794 [Serratia marcescens]
MRNRLVSVTCIVIFFIAAYYVWFYIPNNDMKFNEKITFFIAAIVMVATWVSASSSRRSSVISQKTFEDNLSNSKLNNFEQHYNSLLALHGDLHKSVCEFLDTEDKKDKRDEIVSSGGQSYLKSIRNMKTLEEAHNTLMGHSVISPYMRVLYHLLKHIFTYSNNSVVFKKYTSPLRSLIRNDVIYLVALNASILYKKNSEEDNGYQNYHNYLQCCDFFEHAIFISNEYRKFDEIKNKFENLIMRRIKNRTAVSVREYMETLEIPTIRFDLPKEFILSMIYKNPFSIEFDNAYESIYDYIKEEYERQLNSYRKEIITYETELNNVCGYCDKESNSELCVLIDDLKLLKEIILKNKDRWDLIFYNSLGEATSSSNVFYRMNCADLKCELIVLHKNKKQQVIKDLFHISSIARNELMGIMKKHKLPM